MTLRAHLPVVFGSSVLRSVAMLTSGNTLATALPILTAPALGRLYSPTDYGALAQYMAFASILVVLATLQYQQAIISEKSARGAGKVVWLCLYSSFAVAALTVPILALGWGLGLSATAAGPWLWLLPLSIGFGGIVAAGTFLANRRGDFTQLTLVPLIQVVATIAVSILLGVLNRGSAGLLTAYFVGQLLTTAVYMLYLRQAGVLHLRPGPTLALGYARRHWRYPAFTLPSSFFAQFNLQLPIFALTAVGAPATLGNFSRARQLVALPITVLGGAVGQVFRREGAELYRATGDCRPLMVKTALGLFTAGLLPVALLIWFAPWLFTIYLGPQWGEAGELAQILAPMLLLRLVASPLTTVFQFTGHQRDDLRLMVLSTFVLALAMGTAWVAFGTARAVVVGFSVGFSIIYLTYLVKSISVGRR